MTEEVIDPAAEDALRRRADEAFRENKGHLPVDLAALSPGEIKKIFQELQVHQIELEMQNEELRVVQSELYAARARYFDLYDMAPVGYLTINAAGMIMETNLTAASMLRVPRNALVKRRLADFIFPADQDIYYRHRKVLFETAALQICEIRMLRVDAPPFWSLIEATVAQGVDGAPVCRATISDVTERKHAEEALLQILEQLRRAVETTIQVLVMAVEVKDPYTAGHQRRMTELACAIAAEMGLAEEKIEGLRMAGLIHDIGKITLPTEILSKPTRLSGLEFSLIKEHVQTGYDILKDVESPWPLAEIVRQHHERMDGSGYPCGLKGEEILIESRILAVADVVEAMASYRPYRPALGISAALEEIEKNKGTLYSPAAVDTCLILFREKGYVFV